MNIIEQQRAVAHYRKAFHDMPVGGPMDGAAYGEHLKSKGVGMVLGVVSAVAAVATGGASLAAYAAGTAGIGTAISAGAMIAGGVMTGVGAVSGNKKLMKIGGVLSLAGGIGSMLSSTMSGTAAAGNVSAEAAGETASAYGTSAGSAQTAELAAQDAAFGGTKAALDGAAGNATITLKDAMGSVSQEAATAAPATPAADLSLNTAAPTVDPAAANLQATGSSTQPQGVLTKSLAEQDMATFGPDGADMTLGAQNSEQPFQTPQATNTATTPGSQQTKMLAAQNAGVTTPAPNAPPAGGWMEKMSSFVKDNKEVVELGGKTLKGIGEMYGEGDKGDLLETQSAYYNAKTSQTGAETAAIQQATAQKAQSVANRNSIVTQLNPNSPTYAAEKAAALAAGRRVVDLPGTLGMNGPTMAPAR